MEVFCCGSTRTLSRLPYASLCIHKDQKARTQLMDKMAANNVLHMKGGTGETSYANNSVLQRTIIQKARPVLEDAINDMYDDMSFPECFKMADMGCSSGPNTLMIVSEIIDIVQALSQRHNRKSPEFQVSLNDLPDNDFNTIFQSLPVFYERLEKEKGEELKTCFVSGTPGSFYGRLFPSKSLHFVHSSNSVHWLSKVPERLDNNKGNIYLGMSSPCHVLEAYSNQFQSDFSTFLSLRAEEIVPRGRMVLTFRRRSIADPTSKDYQCLWELLSKSLLDLVTEGLIEEAKVDSFNLPFHAPYKDEVKAIIHKEGSFTLDKLEVFDVNWDGDDENFIFNKYWSGKNIARCIRAAMEPILASHFGESVIDKLFERFAHHVAQHQSVEKLKCFNIIVSLTKK